MAIGLKAVWYHKFPAPSVGPFGLALSASLLSQHEAKASVVRPAVSHVMPAVAPAVEYRSFHGEYVALLLQDSQMPAPLALQKPPSGKCCEALTKPSWVRSSPCNEKRWPRCEKSSNFTTHGIVQSAKQFAGVARDLTSMSST